MLTLRTDFRYVTREEAEANPAYWAVVRNNFKENTIQEPKDSAKAFLYAACIQEGDLTKLDFSDPEFVRQIYQAFRLQKINTNQLVDALLLYYSSRVEFVDEERDSKYQKIKRYAYEDKGPYDYKSIDYGSVEKFEDNLKKVPVNERSYYAVNFSKGREVSFIFNELMNLSEAPPTPLLLEILNAYFKSDPLINDLNHPKKRKAAAQKLFIQFYEKEKKYHDYSNSPMLGDAKLFSNFIAVQERQPTYGLSPDFNADNPSSPLLCMIVPTVATFNTLNSTVHRADAIIPYFSAGNFGNLFLKELDKKNERAIQLPHPDLMKPLEKVHNNYVHGFTLAWHDFLHVWRSSAIQDKALLRYVRTVFEKETGLEISRPIFRSIDMDYSGYKVWLFAKYRPFFIAKSLILLVDLENKDVNDHFLLLLVDMKKNKNQWEKFLGSSPEYFFNEGSEYSLILDSRQYMLQISEYLADLDEIMRKNPKKSSLFYILAYRLKDQPMGLPLCQLVDLLGDQLLKWGSLGLFIKGVDKPKNRVDHYSSEELYKLLMSKVLLLNKPISEDKSANTLIQHLIPFVASQIKRLDTNDDKKSDKSLQEKMRSYMHLFGEMLACNDFSDTKIKEFIFRTAIISYHKRATLGFLSANSWKEWGTLVNKLIKDPTMKDYKESLEASLDSDKRQWAANDQVIKNYQDYKKSFR